jgi:hypothetical protein
VFTFLIVRGAMAASADAPPALTAAQANASDPLKIVMSDEDRRSL